MTPEQTERRRLYMADYRRRPGVRDRQQAQEKVRRDAWTPERKKAEHERRRLYVQRIREAGVHTITLLPKDQFEQMLVEQGGRCAICRRFESSVSGKGRVRRLTIDHDHATGRPRALLCSRCNSAIAFMREDPDVALAAAEYLRWERKRDAMHRLQAALDGETLPPIDRHRVQELQQAASDAMQRALG